MSRRNREKRHQRRSTVPEGYKLVPLANPRTVKLTPEAQEGMEQQLAAFREKFGRDPGPDDPIFFDPKYDTPMHFTEERLWEHLREEIAKMPAHLQAPARQFFAEWEERSQNATDEEYQEWCKKMRGIMGEE